MAIVVLDRICIVGRVQIDRIVSWIKDQTIVVPVCAIQFL
jgi:hypothetical protein